MWENIQKIPAKLTVEKVKLRATDTLKPCTLACQPPWQNIFTMGADTPT